MALPCVNPGLHECLLHGILGVCKSDGTERDGIDHACVVAPQERPNLPVVQLLSLLVDSRTHEPEDPLGRIGGADGRRNVGKADAGRHYVEGGAEASGPRVPESTEILAAIERSHVRLADMPPILGVTKQRCHQLAHRDDFPAPAMVKCRRLWLRSDVERWRDEEWARPWRPESV